MDFTTNFQYQTDVPFTVLTLVSGRILAESMRILTSTVENVEISTTLVDDGATTRFTIRGVRKTLQPIWGVSDRNGVVQPAPGVPPHIPPPISAAHVKCVVCGTRRHQKYVLVTATVEPVWMGIKCAEEHPELGILVKEAFKDPLGKVTKFLEYYKNATQYDTIQVVAAAMCSISQRGYVASGTNFGFSTKYDVETFLTNPEHQSEVDKFLLPASIIVLWAQEQPLGENQFQTLLTKTAKLSTVTKYSFGVLAYLPKAYRAAEIEPAPYEYNNQHVDGMVGTRVHLNLTLRSSQQLRNGNTLYKFSTVTGENVVTFNSKQEAYRVGETVSARCTIKKFDVFRGAKSTMVNRLTVVPHNTV